LTTFTERFAKVVEAKGPEKQVVAELLGVDPNQISQWLGGRKPSLEHLSNMSKKLNVSGHWLLTGEGTMDDTPEEAQKKLGELERKLAEAQDIISRPSDAEPGSVDVLRRAGLLPSDKEPDSEDESTQTEDDDDDPEAEPSGSDPVPARG